MENISYINTTHEEMIEDFNSRISNNEQVKWYAIALQCFQLLVERHYCVYFSKILNIKQY